MNEATYLSGLSSEIEKKIGGKVLKISDRSTLGLPDSSFIMDSIVVYIESKIDDHYVVGENDQVYVQPWRVIKKQSDGLRQFEVCRSIAKHALVVYAIYYPKIKMSAVLPVEVMALFRPEESQSALPYLCNAKYLNHGKGLKQLQPLIEQNQREIYGRLSSRFS